MDITLTQKEKTLLQDQKNHEKLCIEKYTSYANQAKDTQLKQIFQANAQSERTHLNSINQLLGGTIPQMNQQQGGQSAGQSMGSQAAAAGMSSAQSGAFSNSDADLCTDMLMTEKYVSGAYDTAVFEFRDTRVRDVLNHIQKEEQKHGEAIFQYMEKNGMYNVQ